MSVKIYDGLIATDRNVMRTAAAIRATLEPMFYARYKKAVEFAEANVGKSFATLFGAVGPAHKPEWDRWKEPQIDHHEEAVWDLMLQLQKTETHTFSDLDFGYEVSLVPNGRGVTTPPLVLVYSERAGDDYRKALVDAGIVREYGYWDNTDEPDHITQREWNQREKAWCPEGDKRWYNVNEVDLRIAQPSKVNTVYKLISDRAVAGFYTKPKPIKSQPEKFPPGYVEFAAAFSTPVSETAPDDDEGGHPT